jgi:hypothetical protein
MIFPKIYFSIFHILGTFSVSLDFFAPTLWACPLFWQNNWQTTGRLLAAHKKDKNVFFTKERLGRT